MSSPFACLNRAKRGARSKPRSKFLPTTKSFGTTSNKVDISKVNCSSEDESTKDKDIEKVFKDKDLPASTADAAAEDAITERVKASWQCILKQAGTYKARRSEGLSNESAHLRTVRVFVSSTFADFHNEREYLVKRVFPELREWCEARGCRLLECDLRWGIPYNASTDVTLRTCLHEIQRCQTETNDKAFFIGLLGERYGWVPDADVVPENIRDEFNWVDGLSVTHMEVVYGALRKSNPNAVFFIRNPEFLDSLSDADAARYIDKSLYPQTQLITLKEHLRHIYPHQVFHYSCCVSDVARDSDGKVKIIIKGLEEFGENTLEFFKNAISRQFPGAVPKEHDLQNSKDVEEILDSELERQTHLRSQMAASFAGRRDQLAILERYARSENEDATLANSTYTEEVQESLQQLNTEDAQPLFLVLGESCSGKSTLLATLAARAKQNTGGPRLFYHCATCRVGSDLVRLLLCRWIHAIQPKAVSIDHLTETSFAVVVELLHKTLLEAANKDEKWLFVIDGLDQLSDAADQNALFWLPSRLPASLRLICSATPSSFLLARVHTPQQLDLPPLSSSDRGELVTMFFSAYNKKLTSDQQSLLCSKEGASNALWLSVACEELRVNAQHRTLSATIASLPPSLSGLIRWLVNRLVSEDDHQDIKKLLELLVAVQSRGLPECDVAVLLSNEYEPIPTLRVAQALRLSRALILEVVDFNLRQKCYKLRHPDMAEAIRDLFLPTLNDIQQVASHIAQFYEAADRNSHTSVSLLPPMLDAWKLHRRLATFLKSNIHSRFMHDFQKSRFMRRGRCPTPVREGMSGSNKIYICHMCKSRAQTAFVSFAQQCWVCGARVSVLKPAPALYCYKHYFNLQAPGNDVKCVSCGRLSPSDRSAFSATPALLCFNCATFSCAALL